MKNRDISALVPNWVPPIRPNGAVLEGQYARLEPVLAATHASDLFAANSTSDAIWDYLPYGPFSCLEDYTDWLRNIEGGQDPQFYAVFDKERGHWAGVASYLRIAPDAGSIEVGHINFSPALQRTRAATDAMYLMMKWAFETGYRRYEWKCNAANIGSRRAAERLGFSYEGVFRQAMIVKGRNRDTAWFAAIDKEWPKLKSTFEQWLASENFDPDGRQLVRLSDLTASIRVQDDPRLHYTTFRPSRRS